MKPLPFGRVSVGAIFNDMDGTTYVKTAKSMLANRTEDGPQFINLNCMILVPNTNKDKRGQLRGKDDDIYCEVLEPSEVASLKLETDSELEARSND